MPFSKIIELIESRYFGKYGIHGLAEDRISRIAILWVDPKQKDVFDLHLKDIENDAAPYQVKVIISPRGILL